MGGRRQGSLLFWDATQVRTRPAPNLRTAGARLGIKILTFKREIDLKFEVPTGHHFQMTSDFIAAISHSGPSRCVGSARILWENYLEAYRWLKYAISSLQCLLPPL